MKSRLFVFVSAVALLLVARPAHAARHIVLDLTVPAQIAATLETPFGCDHRGNTVVLAGEWTTSAVEGAIWLQNGAGKQSISKDALVSFTLHDFVRTQFQKQGSLPDGVTGNPWIAIAAKDPEVTGYPTDATIVGRCVQGIDGTALFEFARTVHLDFDVTAGDCENAGGPHIVISGTLALGGANVVVYLSNQRATPQHWASTDARLELEVVPAEDPAVWTKKPAWAMDGGGTGAGGNPYVFLQIAGQTFNLGRCNKI